jgi:hypothetical protein
MWPFQVAGDYGAPALQFCDAMELGMAENAFLKQTRYLEGFSPVQARTGDCGRPAFR